MDSILYTNSTRQKHNLFDTQILITLYTIKSQCHIYLYKNEPQVNKLTYSSFSFCLMPYIIGETIKFMERAIYNERKHKSVK